MKTLHYSLGLLLLLVGGLSSLTAQPIVDDEGDVAIGSLTTEPTALLELVSSEKGFLVPRMSEVDRDNIVAPAASLVIYNTDTDEFNYWDPSTGQWEIFITTANIFMHAWVLEGNNLDVALNPLLQDAYDGTNGAYLGTNSADNAVIATLQAQAIDFYTNNTHRALIDAAGNFYPSTDDTYTLGTDDNRWSDVYANGGSVHVGPTGGEGAGTELDLGYAANQGTITVDATPTPQVIIDAAASRMYLNADGAGLDEVQINAAADGVFINPDGAGGSEFFVSAAGDIVVVDPDAASGPEMVVNGTTVDVDASLLVDADNDNTQNVTVNAAGVAVDGDDDGANDIFVSGANGDVTIGNNTTTDNTFINGQVFQTESSGGDGYTLTESGIGDAFQAFESGLGSGLDVIESDDGQGVIIIENNGGNGVLLTENDIGNGIQIMENGSGVGLLVNENDADNGITVNAGGTGLGIEVNGGAVDGNAAANEFGDGAAAQQLSVLGSADAVIGNTLVLNPTVWDLVVAGDQVTTGLIKAGGSIWIDGVTPGNHQMVADDQLNVGTTTGDDLTLSTAGLNAVVVDGGTQDVNILNNVDVDGNGNVDGDFNVVGAATMQSTLDVNGITTLNSNLNVNGPTDLNSTLNVDGSVTINNTITQTGGGQNTFSGNVDAQNGLDVSGQNLTVDAGVSLSAPGSGHVMGTNGVDANVLTVEGSNGGATELVVNGDASISGGLILGFMTPGSVIFAGPGGTLSQDNPNFFWNNGTNRLGIGNNAPSQALDVTGRVNSTESYDIDGNRFLWNGPAAGQLNNTFVGNTGNTTTTGDFNTHVGSRAGINQTGGFYNTYVGYQAGFSTQGGQFNVFVGANSAIANIGGSANVVMGWNAGLNMNSTANTMVGNNSGTGTTSGSFNTYLGQTAGDANATGSNNTALGNNADFGAGNLTNATAVGANAVVSQSNALVLGNNADVGIGTSTPSQRLDVVGRVNSTESYDIDGNRFVWNGSTGVNTFVGNTQSAATGSSNTFVGRFAGQDMTTGVGNTYVGNVAGTNSTGDFNVVVGSSAATSMVAGGDNTVVGQGAMQNVVLRDGMTVVGRNAGNNLNGVIGGFTGVTLLGHSAESVNGVSNSTAIGYQSIVNQSNSVVLGSVAGQNGAGATANVGIGTTTPSARLNVVGDVTIETGDVVLPYATIANGGVIPVDRVVVLVNGDGANATQATVTLPAAGTNGQILIITTDDPDGVIINGGSAVFATANQHTAIRYIRAGGNWIAEN